MMGRILRLRLRGGLIFGRPVIFGGACYRNLRILIQMLLFLLDMKEN